MTVEHAYEDILEKDRRAMQQTPYVGDDAVKEAVLRSAHAFQFSWDEARMRGGSEGYAAALGEVRSPGLPESQMVNVARRKGPFGDTVHITTEHGSKNEPVDVEEVPPPRRQILEEAAELIDGDRNRSYGSPVANFANTAKLLNARFEHMFKDGYEFTADDVATIQILVKLSRMITTPEKKDHWVDVIGYAGCGWECVEDAVS